MHVLAIETTGKYASCALIDGKANIIDEKSKETMNHLKDLMPMVDRLLKKANLKKEELTGIAVSVGPGSYTGIRIGMATAKALAQSLNLPCVPVKTLNSFLYQEKEAGIICPIINARRGQVYGALFDRGEYNFRTLIAPGPYMLSSFLDMVKASTFGKVLFYGDGIDAYEGEIKEEIPADRRGFADERIRYQSAHAVAQDAFMKFLRGQTMKYDELEAEYMRETEAEQKLRDKILEKEHEAKMERMRKNS